MNDIEKKLFKIIEEHGKISSNNLMKLAVSSKVGAFGTCQKYLRDMILNGKIIKCPTGVDQFVYYYAHKELYDLEKRIEKNINELITSFDEKFKTFQNVYEKLSEESRTTVFATLSMLLYCIKLKITSINWVAHDAEFKNHKIVTQSDQVNELSKKLMEFIISQNDHLNILNLADTRFNLLGDILEKELDDIFSSLHPE